MIPPPTQIMAAVPTALRNFRKPGMPRTSVRPNARQVRPTSVPLSLPSTAAGEYYTVHVDGYNANHVKVGTVLARGSDWHGWDVRFVDPPQ